MKKLMILLVLALFSFCSFGQNKKIEQKVMVSGSSEPGLKLIKVNEEFFVFPIQTDGAETENVVIGKTFGFIEVEFLKDKNVFVVHARRVDTNEEIQFVLLHAELALTLYEVMDGEIKELYLYGMKVSPEDLNLLGKDGVALESDMYLLTGVSTYKISGSIGLVAVYDNYLNTSEEKSSMIDSVGKISSLMFETSRIYKREPDGIPDGTDATKRFLSKFGFLVVRSWHAKESSSENRSTTSLDGFRNISGPNSDKKSKKGKKDIKPFNPDDWSD